ncbi:hypothetical protein ACVIYH_004852 [Bradyrhizobium diazoefficiens]
MKLQTLELTILSDHIEFNVIGFSSYRGGNASLAIDLAKQLDDLEYAETDQRLGVLQPYMDILIPADFAAWYRDWSSLIARRSGSEERGDQDGESVSRRDDDRRDDCRAQEFCLL